MLLKEIAVKAITPARLAVYRDRLHAWAETCRQQRWPPGTPEYLLRGYFEILKATGDIPRMVACATDTPRHDRMLDLSGGDHAALTEITSTQDLILATDDPDLCGMALLCLRRNDLADRNANVPAVWGRLGQLARAEWLARSITDPGRQAWALAALAKVVAEHGDHERARTLLVEAESLARDITDPNQQARALADLAMAGSQAPDGHRQGSDSQVFEAEATLRRSRRLLAGALAVGRWADSLAALERIDPPALRVRPRDRLSAQALQCHSGSIRFAGGERDRADEVVAPTRLVEVGMERAIALRR